MSKLKAVVTVLENSPSYDVPKAVLGWVESTGTIKWGYWNSPARISVEHCEADGAGAGVELTGAGLDAAEVDAAGFQWLIQETVWPSIVAVTQTALDAAADELAGAGVVAGAELAGSELIGAELAGAELAGTELAGAELAGIELAGAELAVAELAGAELTGAELTGAELTGTELIGAELTGAELTGAELTGAELTGAEVADAELTGAELTGAEVADAELTGAELTGAELTDAELTGAEVADAEPPELTDADEAEVLVAELLEELLDEDTTLTGQVKSKRGVVLKVLPTIPKEVAGAVG
jgi:uncharacterized protein YjbI with pentapeptide repeats